MSAEIDPKYLVTPETKWLWPLDWAEPRTDTDGDPYMLAVGAAPAAFITVEPVVRVRIGDLTAGNQTVHLSLADSQALRESLYQAERQAALQFDSSSEDLDE